MEYRSTASDPVTQHIQGGACNSRKLQLASPVLLRVRVCAQLCFQSSAAKGLQAQEARAKCGWAVFSLGLIISREDVCQGAS